MNVSPCTTPMPTRQSDRSPSKGSRTDPSRRVDVFGIGVSEIVAREIISQAARMAARRPILNIIVASMRARKGRMAAYTIDASNGAAARRLHGPRPAQQLPAGVPVAGHGVVAEVLA